LKPFEAKATSAGGNKVFVSLKSYIRSFVSFRASKVL
jgi:hypothetical protein